eukprot:4882884-Amphidinium_carterae.1
MSGSVLGQESAAVGSGHAGSMSACFANMGQSGRNQTQNPQLVSNSASSGSVGFGATSWFPPSENAADAFLAQAGHEDNLEIRKERNRLPEFDVSSADAVSTLHTFETWLLRCSTSISTWCKNPRD